MSERLAEELIQVLQGPEKLLALPPSSLGGIILQLINSKLPQSNQGSFHPGAIAKNLSKLDRAFADERINMAVMEAWTWLLSEGMVAPILGDTNGWHFITRKGLSVLTEHDLDSLKNASLLPKEIIHPKILNAVTSDFFQGDYESAIFKAFKQVEVETRAKGGFSNDDIGVPLMRKAFDKDKGPLRDQNPETPDGEREALAHLFAGATGVFKNPGSHREVDVEDPAEAVEIIMLASQLMRLLDRRQKP